MHNYKGTHLLLLYITYFNPQAIHVASTNLHTERRAPSPVEEDEPYTICIEQIVKGKVINSLQCNHIYHHQRIIDWIRMNIRCHTCRDTIF